MSRLLKASVLSSLALACACVMAADTPSSQDMDTVRVVNATSAKYWVSPDEFVYLGGSYPLSNGSDLKFRKVGNNNFFVSITGMPETEVFAQSGTRFVAKDKSVQISFEVHDSGFATDLTVEYRPTNGVAQTNNPSGFIVARNN
jgi:hypothetical protein